MKNILIPVLLAVLILTGCSGSQQITSSWFNKEVAPKHYESVLVVALIPNNTQRLSIEEKMAEVLEARGVKTRKSTEWVQSVLSPDKILSKEQQEQIIHESGCESVLTISLLDIKTEERYIHESSPMPLPPYRFAYYRSYYSYYNYRYNQVYSPGYVEQETTFFFETNFYDTSTEQLLWSIQSSAFEPYNIDSWFNEYKSMIVKQLQKEGLLKK